MTTKSLLHSSLLDNQYYNSMLVGNDFYNPPAESLLIQEILSANQETVTFNSLDTLAAGYKHLQLKISATTNRGADNDSLEITFNGDSGANYASSYLFYESGLKTASENTKSFILPGPYCLAGNSSNTMRGVAIVDILDAFSTNKFKTSRSLSGNLASTRGFTALSTGSWANNNPITSITFNQSYGSQFVAGSRFTLIGVR